MKVNLFTSSKLLKGKAIICLFGCGLVLSSLGLLVKAKSHDDFGEARQVAPDSLIKKAISENYLSADGKTVYPQVLRLKAEKDLYVFDFNSPELCGIRGCLYAIYTRDGDQVLSIYLKSELPNKTTKLFAEDGTEKGFPCVRTSQFDKKDNKMIATRYCYQGGTLIPIFSQSLEVRN